MLVGSAGMLEESFDASALSLDTLVIHAIGAWFQLGNGTVTPA